MNFNYTNISIYNSTGSFITSVIDTNSDVRTNYLDVTVDGIYSVNVTSYDLFGYSTTVNHGNITVAANGPSISFVDPTFADNSYTNLPSTTVNVSVIPLLHSTAFIDWQDVSINTKLVLWHRFNNENDETSDTFKDRSVYGNDGTCDSGSGYCPTYTTSGMFGSAYSYDGSDDHIIISDTGNLEFTTGDNITISAWVYTNSQDVKRVIIAKGRTSRRDYELSITDKNNLEFSYIATDDSLQRYSLDDALNTNTWYNVVAVNSFGDGSSIKLYVNGVQVSGSWRDGDGSKTPYTTGYDLWIGSGLGDDESPTSSFSGTIDDVIIQRRILSDAEVLALYDASNPS